MTEQLPNYDQWLARHRSYTTVAYCDTCEPSQAIVVDYEEENGIGWITPEECPDCGGSLTLDAPERP